MGDLDLSSFSGELLGEDKEQTTPREREEPGEWKRALEEKPFMLGESLPVVPAKLVKKIKKGEFLDMSELLKDNVEAERRRSLSKGANVGARQQGERCRIC